MEEVISEEEREESPRTTANMTGVEVDREIGSFQDTLRERTEVEVGQDHGQWKMQIETELGVLYAKSMFIFPRIVQAW